MRKQIFGGRSLIAVVALSLTMGALATATPGAFADPNTDSPGTANVQQLTKSQKQQIGKIEAELAGLRAKQNQTQLDEEIASENYNRALDELDAAKESADQAQVSENAANQERDRARTEIAKLIMAVYRDRSLSLAPLKPYMEADGIHNMEMRRQAVQRFGADADKKIQHYDAAEAVAKVLHGEAVKNVEKQQAALSKVDEEREKSANIAREATAKVAALEQQRNEKIAELARLRRVSIEQERQRQAELEAAAEARAEAAARKRAEAAQAKARAQAAAKAKREAAAQAARVKEAAAQAARQEAAAQAARQEAAAAKAAQKAAAASKSDSKQADKDAEAKAAQAKAAEAQAKAAEAQAKAKAAEAKAKAAREKAAQEQAAKDAANVNPNAPVSPKAQGALAWAQQNLGIPYVWGGSSSNGYDCSGFTQGAWGSQGVRIPHSSRMQYSRGAKVPLDDAAPGDLLFWSHDGSAGSIHHVAMYIGNDTMVEAPRPGSFTKVSKVRYRGIMPYAVRLG